MANKRVFIMEFYQIVRVCCDLWVWLKRVRHRRFDRDMISATQDRVKWNNYFILRMGIASLYFRCKVPNLCDSVSFYLSITLLINMIQINWIIFVCNILIWYENSILLYLLFYINNLFVFIRKDRKREKMSKLCNKPNWVGTT